MALVFQPDTPYAILAAVATLFSGLDCEDETYDEIFEAIRNIKRPRPESPAFMARTFRGPTCGADGERMSDSYLAMSLFIRPVAAKTVTGTPTPDQT